MFADSNQIGTLKVSRWPRSIRFGWIAGWLIVGLVVAGLLLGLIWSNGLVRYPGAERQTATQVQFQSQPTMGFSQQSAYQTPDDLPQVLGWYAQHLGLGHEVPNGDNCVTMTQDDTRLLVQQSLTVTLCAHPTRTLIFVERSLAVP